MNAAPSPPVLLCLPPAGTGAGLFRNWARIAPNTMTVHSVALPGREKRYNEPPPLSIDALADQLAMKLEPYVGGRYAFFGYSMGALVGYEIARRFSGAGLRQPDVFFVLGCNAPDRTVYEREPFHTMAPAAFNQALVDLGGIEAEILNTSRRSCGDRVRVRKRGSGCAMTSNTKRASLTFLVMGPECESIGRFPKG